MAKNAYPTGADLNTFLLAAGFQPAFIAALDQGAAGNLNTFAQAGWEAFNEQRGGPMLATTQTREYARPRSGQVFPQVIPLKAELLSVTAVTDQGTTLIGSGTTPDYRLEPINAPDDGKPYDCIRFWRWYWWGGPPYWVLAPPIAITGSWGYGTTIPEDAWLGMLAMAGTLMFPLIQQAKSRGIQSWREADMAQTWGINPLKGLWDGWLTMAMMTAGGLGPDGTYHNGRYRRVTVP